MVVTHVLRCRYGNWQHVGRRGGSTEGETRLMACKSAWGTADVQSRDVVYAIKDTLNCSLRYSAEGLQFSMLSTSVHLTCCARYAGILYLCYRCWAAHLYSLHAVTICKPTRYRQCCRVVTLLSQNNKVISCHGLSGVTIADRGLFAVQYYFFHESSCSACICRCV